ncbi:hypothetical protein PUNSTDRAFT_139607 [Punctularia strigosozonata HHB-11173 SS5]|uniref:Uncharacterized protein n=1 Tax=Punctularia strigosozonata (strain HHB-11173) TaxID=741275 RepID=R7S2A1_PUNST|nr:uncharacterized protein PUNSTDRAFT_139607 [Punctularia strigosozonata HHB-11173 SS5]EIN03376.1 hypothetical protein PUNSTDRAFT_139607 [Punctularia strigosozonata HHB-11173 SS5]
MASAIADEEIKDIKFPKEFEIAYEEHKASEEAQLKTLWGKRIPFPGPPPSRAQEALREEDIPRLREQWRERIADITGDIPLERPPYREGETNVVADALSRCHKADRPSENPAPYYFVDADRRLDPAGDDLPALRNEEIAHLNAMRLPEAIESRDLEAEMLAPESDAPEITPPVMSEDDPVVYEAQYEKTTGMIPSIGPEKKFLAYHTVGSALGA